MYTSNDEARVGFEEVVDVIWYNRVNVAGGGGWKYTELSDRETLSVSTLVVVDEWKGTGVPLEASRNGRLQRMLLKEETRAAILAVQG